MRRRALLASIGTGIGTVLAGCSSLSSEDADSSGIEQYYTTTEFGEEVALTVEVTDDVEEVALRDESGRTATTESVPSASTIVDIPLSDSRFGDLEVDRGSYEIVALENSGNERGVEEITLESEYEISNVRPYPDSDDDLTRCIQFDVEVTGNVPVQLDEIQRDGYLNWSDNISGGLGEIKDRPNASSSTFWPDHTVTYILDASSFGTTNHYEFDLQEGTHTAEFTFVSEHSAPTTIEVEYSAEGDVVQDGVYHGRENLWFENISIEN